MKVSDIEKGICDVWVSKLIWEWYKQNGILRQKTGKNMLMPPNFAIGKVMSRWGMWIPEKRVIEISLILLRKFEWAAVVDILKHEMAHQLVSEYLQTQHSPHGDSFKFACKLLDANPNRVISDAFLEGKNGGDEAIVTKIKKLLAKGSDVAVTEAEGEIFLKKAQELMLRYNVEIADLVKTGQFYVQRPVTPLVRRWPDYFSSIGYLMDRFYNVQYIRYNFANGSYLEYFGESANVDVAEYVTHVLIQQGEYLYEEFLKLHRERRAQGLVFRKASQAAFMNGLIKGYSQKLEAQRAAIFTQSDPFTDDGKSHTDGMNRCQEIILASNKILKEHFEQQYKPRHIHRNGTRGAGFHDGMLAGGSLSINPGISGGSTGLALKA